MHVPYGSLDPTHGKIRPKRLGMLLDQLGLCSSWMEEGPIVSRASKLNISPALLDMLRDPGSAWRFEPAGHWAEVSGLRSKDEVCWLIVGKTHRKVRSPLLLVLSLHSVLPLLFEWC